MGARYMECSSKEMVGVTEIFREAIDTVVANDRSNQQQQIQSRPTNQPSGMKKKKKRTCNFL
jgi:Ras family protein A